MNFFKVMFSGILIPFLFSSCDEEEVPVKKEEEVLVESVINQKPFPSHTEYVGTHIKPDTYSQTELDDHTKEFYDQWKNSYLKNDCDPTEYYIKYQDTKNTVSEAHGYGMMIMGIMAGYETNAKQYFDGLYKYYKSHPSSINEHLMDWQQISCNDYPDPVADGSATDGDIDIAFSLLLAHSQWGSDGAVNYLSEAKNIINAIMADEINPSTWTVKLGDWSVASDPGFYYGTRSSDFITSHFKTFSAVTNNGDWNKVVDKCYSLIEENQNSTTGLMPDFIINTDTASEPANPNFLEGEYDGDYYYNSCRFPWRIGTDFLINGDDRAKLAINKLNTWLSNSTTGDINSISSGYLLNGTAIYDWNDASFLGPFTVGAMTDPNQQKWLNDLYSELVLNNNVADGDYYSNSLKLFSLITISGNYWNPDL